MSGLLGIWSADPQRLARGPAALSSMDHALGYELADHAGTGFYAGVCGLPGAVALLVESEAEVVAEAPTGPLVVAFRGQLSNYRELQRELRLGSAFAPVAVVAAAYRAWGAKLFDRLEGAFSLIVHDRQNGRAVAGSDPCCVHALYAVRLGDDCLIASEAKAFLAVPPFRARLDRDALADTLTFSYAFEGRPLFAGVRGLPHGCHYELERGELRVVRHWNAAERPSGSLRGAAYIDRLEEAVRRSAAEAFAESGVVLPLTGGLDSRLLAALVPSEADVRAITFGAPSDHDAAIAARVAAVCGLPHDVLPFDQAYVEHFAAETVWLLEGRMNPMRNITGGLMDQLRPAPAFINGAGAAAGRRFLRSRMLVPNRAWICGTDEYFEQHLSEHDDFLKLLPGEYDDVVRESDALQEESFERRLSLLRATRGRPLVDRLDLFIIQQDERYGQLGLALADIWVPARAPLLTRGWIEAMLDGAVSERIDDRSRLRLLQRVSKRVSAVPWALTHLPIPASIQVLNALRVVGALRHRPHLSLYEQQQPAAASPAGGGSSLARRVKNLLYRQGESRDDWLRGPSRAFLERILLSPRLGDHGVFSPKGVARLLDRQAAGEPLAGLVGIVLQVELWQRQFEDGDRYDLRRR